MCLAKAYVGEQGQPVMEDIALLQTTGHTVHLSSLFGERKELEASVEEIDFQSGRIILKPREAAGK